MRWTTAWVVVLLAGACRGEPEAADNAGANRPVVDTTNRDPLDGLSRQQIEQSAQPMSPAQAEQMGIIDSTINVEDQAPPERLIPASPPAAPPR